MPAVAILAVPALAAVAVMRRRWRKHRKGPWVTNATWTRRGDKVLHPLGRAHPWHHLPIWHRAGIETGAWTVALATGYGLLFATTATITVLAAATTAGFSYGTWLAWRWSCQWKHDRHYVRPVQNYVAVRTGHRPETVKVTLDGKTVTAVAINWHPEAAIGPPEKQLALEAVTTRLAIEAPDEEWNLRGRSRAVVFTRSDPPPFPVSWGDVADAVKRAAPNELVFGIGKRDEITKAAYSESPHVAIPGGSGGGKSNLAAFLLLQELMRGSLIFNLDPKWISHLWLQNLPNVINAHDIPDLHLALCWLGRELLRRTKAAWYSAAGTGRVRVKPRNRIIVLAEELNYGMPGLKDHWREIRGKDDPKQSPAIAGLSALSCAGRASDIHEWLIAQLLTVESTGVRDSTIRTNAGIKAMARWDPPGWAMAVGKHVPMPPQTTIPGRIQLVTGDVPRETQVPYLHLDDKDPDVADKAVAWARELAVSGEVAQIPSGPEGIPPQLWPASVLGQTQLEITPGEEAFVLGQGRPAGGLTLREATRQGLFVSLDAARKAVQRSALEPVRDPDGVPVRDGNAYLYHLADLARTARS